MKRQLQTDLEHTKGGIWAEHVVDDHDACAVHDANANRSPGAGCQVIRMADRARPQLVEVEI